MLLGVLGLGELARVDPKRYVRTGLAQLPGDVNNVLALGDSRRGERVPQIMEAGERRAELWDPRSLALHRPFAHDLGDWRLAALPEALPYGNADSLYRKGYADNESGGRICPRPAER